MKYAAFGTLALIAAVGCLVWWLNAGGEPRKFWFFCQFLKECGL